MAFYDVAEIIVQQQMKPYTVSQSLNFSAYLKFVTTMLSEDVEHAVRNFQLLDDNIRRRIIDKSSDIAENVSNLHLSFSLQVEFTDISATAHVLVFGITNAQSECG
jgi:hypothetical protein